MVNSKQDYPITFDELIKNNAYSAHHFLDHAQYFMQHKPKYIVVSLFRYKAVITNPRSNKSVILKCHYRGRTSKTFSIIDPINKQELCTIHYVVPPKTFMHIVLAHIMI